MSDLHNRNVNNSVPPEEIRRIDGFGEKHALNDKGGFSSFHHFEQQEEGANRTKLIGGALVVALLLSVAGIYAHTGSGSHPAGVTEKTPASSVASNLAAAAPIQTTPTPQDAASGTTAKSPYDAAAPADDRASAAPDVTSEKPAKSARAHAVPPKDEAVQNTAETEPSAQMNRDSSAADRATMNGPVAVTDSAAPADATNVGAMPTPPSPPASSVASNGQPAPTPEADSPAQDVPAAPAVTPDQQPVMAPTAPAPQPEQQQAAQSAAQPQ